MTYQGGTSSQTSHGPSSLVIYKEILGFVIWEAEKCVK
jgi:hypothetical protein